MNIAIIGTISSSLLGFRAPFITKLVDEGITIYAFAMDYDENTIRQVEKLGAIPVKYSLSRYGLNPFVEIINTFSLAQKIRKLNISMVFCYFSKPVIFGTLAAKLVGVKRCVGMLEGLGYAFTKLPEGWSLKQTIIRSIQVSLYKISTPYLDRLIVLNPDDKKDLLDFYSLKPRDVSILGGIGLDLQKYQFSPLHKSEVVNFTFIGRLIKEKGVEYFLAAAEIVKNKYPNSKFTLLGSIEQHSSSSISLEKFNQLCKQGVIDYPGMVSNVSEWLAKCSVFVLPSYREGVPRSTQEAMATGRAIITTDVPGCRETVKDRLNGLIVPPHDITALVEAMSYFMENRDQIAVMGLESYKIAIEKFDAEKVNARLYKMVMID